MSTGTPHKWAVTRQEEHPVIDNTGNPTTEHVTHFITAGGHESTVSHMDNVYSAENVAASIEHKSNELMKVHNLNSTVHPTPPGEAA